MSTAIYLLTIFVIKKLINKFDYEIDYAGDNVHHEPQLIKYLDTTTHAGLNEIAP